MPASALGKRQARRSHPHRRGYLKVPARRRHRALLFDALYGTLFDVHPVVLQGSHNISEDAEALAILWRQRQLEYTWLLALLGHYEDFCRAYPIL